MRIAILAVTLMALAACNVTKDEQNETVTAEFNQAVAENELEAAANTAEDIAKDVGNEVEKAANKVENRVENVEVDVDLNKAD